MSYNQSELLYYNANFNSGRGIFLEWERYSGSAATAYKVYRSERFDGEFELATTLAWPINEVIDTTGAATHYYKVEEIDVNGATLSTSEAFNGDELLTKSSLRYELEHLLNLPIYDEEVLFHKNRTRATTAFPFWNYYPRPEIRITGASEEGDQDSMIALSEFSPVYKTINGDIDPLDYNIKGESNALTNGNNYPNGLKVKLDYNSNIYFVNSSGSPVSIEPYDTVFCSYNVKAFTSQHMNAALYMALQVINSQPGATKYSTVANSPYYYEPAIVYGACYFLLRNLTVQLTQRQRRLLLEDPDARVIDDIRQAANMYKEQFDNLVKSLPISRFPGIRGVVTPEFNMPGGRSRFFRYAWNLGTGN